MVSADHVAEMNKVLQEIHAVLSKHEVCAFISGDCESVRNQLEGQYRGYSDYYDTPDTDTDDDDEGDDDEGYRELHFSLSDGVDYFGGRELVAVFKRYEADAVVAALADAFGNWKTGSFGRTWEFGDLKLTVSMHQ